MYYPNKSHRKPVGLPSKSQKLAEFFGILFGDGSLTPWQCMVSLNGTRDLEYADYVRSLIFDLFQLHARTVHRKGRNCIVLVLSSVTLVEYLTGLGAVVGNKIRNISEVPSWIHENEAWHNAFIRGLMDTDGCLYIHKHIIAGKHYQNIGLCFSSYSPPLVESFVKGLHKSGIPAKLSRSGKLVYVYRHQGVVDYLKIFETRNPRIARVYQDWRGVRVVD